MSNWNNDNYEPTGHRNNETLGYEPYRRQQGPNWYTWAPMLAAGAVLVAAASFFTAQALDSDPQPQLVAGSVVGDPTAVPTPSNGAAETPAGESNESIPNATPEETQPPIATATPEATQPPPPPPTATPTPQPDDAPTIAAWATAKVRFVTLSLSATDDRGIASINVDFGDGQVVDLPIDGSNRTQIDEEVSTSFATGGARDITVTVTDSAGQVTSESYPVFIRHQVGVNLWNIDDDAYVYVNGKEVYYRDATTGSVDISNHLVQGSNTVEIWLGNKGCFNASLSANISINGTYVSERHYDSGGWTHCGWQVEWSYRIDGNTGAATQLK